MQEPLLSMQMSDALSVPVALFCGTALAQTLDHFGLLPHKLVMSGDSSNLIDDVLFNPHHVSEDEASGLQMKKRCLWMNNNWLTNLMSALRRNGVSRTSGY